MMSFISNLVGGAASWETNAASPTDSGEKSILSKEMDDLSADQIMEGIEKHVRDGKAKTGQESNVEVADKDGGIMVTLTFTHPETQVQWQSFQLYKKDGSSWIINFYPTPSLLEKGTAANTTTIKVHSEPVRIEAWITNNGARYSGPMWKGVLDTLLGNLDGKVCWTRC